MSHYQDQRDVQSFLDKQEAKIWPTEERIDTIGTNGNEGEHYEEVVHPLHYQAFGIDVMEIVARSMTEEAFRGFCLGNWLKYKLRAGNKGTPDSDLAKSENYKTMFDGYKAYCITSMPF